MKNVLVTGVGGFVGSHCLEYWLDKTDWNFLVIDSFKHKGTYSRLNAIPNLDVNRVKIFRHDLAAPIDRQLENLLLQRSIVFGETPTVPIDYIINIASDSAVERSITDPGQCWKNNCDLIFNMLEFARQVKPQLFLHFSTDEVYGEAEPDKAHHEWDVILPSNPYCLLPNTNIITKNGLIKIKNFNPFVHTLLSNNGHKIVEAECVKKFEHDYNGDVYLISANGLKITTTEQHKFFRKETFYTELKSPRLWNGKLITKHPHQRVVEVAAKDLKVGDYVLTTREIPVENNEVKNKSTTLCWARIKKIKVSRYRGKVYDLEAPKYHNYVANHFIVHNSASKAAQEALSISYWRTYDVPLVLVNCMNIIGERQDTEKFLPRLVWKIATDQEMPIYGEPGKIGSRFYIHAKNIADALVFLSNKTPVMYSEDTKRPDRYNIVGDLEMDNLQVAQYVATCMNKELKYKLIPAEAARKGYDKRYALDGTKLYNLGWSHPMSTLDSIKQIVDWTMKNPHWIL